MKATAIATTGTADAAAELQRVAALETAASRADVWVLSAIAVALILRLARLDAAALWLDETKTAQWVALPWGEMVRTVLADNHPPLYFVLLKTWTLIAGDSEWALRLPSAVASCAAVVGIARLGRALGGTRAARWAAWLAAVSPYLIHHGQEARMYALVAALGAAQVVILARFVNGDTSRLGAAFPFLALALVATHYYGNFFVAGELLVLCIVDPGRWRAWLLAAGLTAAAMAASLLSAMRFGRHTAGAEYTTSWLDLPGTVWSMLGGYTLLPSSEALHYAGLRAVLPYVPIAMVTAGALAVSLWLACRALPWRARVLTMVPLASALLLPFAVRLVAAVGMNPRYAAAAMPLLPALIAVAAPAAPARDWRTAAALVILAASALGTVLHLRQPGHGREDIRAATAWLDSHVPQDEAILITSTEMDELARFYWPARPRRVYPHWKTLARADNAARLADELPFPNSERAVYVIGRAWLSDPDGALQRALRTRYAQCPGADVRGIRILCLRNPRGTAAP